MWCLITDKHGIETCVNFNQVSLFKKMLEEDETLKQKEGEIVVKPLLPTLVIMLDYGNFIKVVYGMAEERDKDFAEIMNRLIDNSKNCFRLRCKEYFFSK